MFYLLPFLLYASFSVASPLSPAAANAGSVAAPAVAQGKPSSEGVTTFDGVSLAGIQEKPSVAAIAAGAISQSGWTATADSAQAGNPVSAAIDGNNPTIWHSEYSPTLTPLPHQITIDMKQTYLIGSITYLPRQDGNTNGRIGQHVISFSTDGTTFKPVAYGTWIDDANLKTTTFTPVNGRYLQIQALTEAGNRGPWTSAAEINAYTATQSAPPPPQGKGSWGPTIDFPLVPVSMANDYATGNIIAWSSYDPSTFGGSPGTQTVTATYIPSSQTVTEAIITNTNHDMFCVGLCLDFSGRAIATGGNTASATSIYDSGPNTWTKGPPMNIARGYQAMVTASTGNVFTIGASWSGGQGGKNGELYTSSSGTWGLLSGAPVAPMLTADAQGIYRADNHGWLFGWKNAYVFQGGPSVAMNWYGTTGSGSQSAAGTRTGDTDAMCGNAAMYDAVNGKILAVGGSTSYQNVNSTSNAHIITIGTPPAVATVTTIGNMAYQRVFANSVILPDGTVLIMGGQITAVPFSDDTSQYVPELFNPATNTFTQLAPASIPRNYHSTGVLLPDGTVLNGGGGLCGGCATNHYDAQVFNPPYLYTSTGALAARPVISSVSVASIKLGGTFTATTNTAVTNGFALVRMGSTTHTVNTDQRRIKLTPTGNSGTTYTLVIPTDPGVAIPGFWFLFALNSAGVPSISQKLRITLT